MGSHDCARHVLAGEKGGEIGSTQSNSSLAKMRSNSLAFVTNQTCEQEIWKTPSWPLPPSSPWTVESDPICF